MEDIVGTRYISLAQNFKKSGSKEGEARGLIIEIADQLSPAVNDATVTECNNGTQHISMMRSGLADSVWTKLYGGPIPSRGSVTEVIDSTGTLESVSTIGAKHLELAGKDKASLLMSEAHAHIEAMTIEVEKTLFYGDQATEPVTFTGLGPRFSTLSQDVMSANQIVDGGGAGSDNTSIWFVTWGDQYCKLLYPSGTQGGLTRRRLPEETQLGSDGSVVRVHREMFKWEVGFACSDFRGVARVANVDVTKLRHDPEAGGADLVTLLIDGYNKIALRSSGRHVIYVNSTISTALDHQSRKDKNVLLSLQDYQGKPVRSFRGIPIRVSDAIMNTEARVI